MDIPELRGHLKEYRKAWCEAGHDGNGDVSLRIPVYAADNEEPPWKNRRTASTPTSTAWGPCCGRSHQPGGSRCRPPQGRADRLATMSYEEMLQTKVAFGTGERLTDRFTELEEELGWTAS